MSVSTPVSPRPEDTTFIVVLKRDCPTCAMLQGVIAELEDADCSLQIWCQDDPGFPPTGRDIGDDRSLEQSWRLNIEIVPTAIRLTDGQETDRTEGWDRQAWLALFEVPALGADLPQALARAYQGVEAIHFEGKTFRRDIGYRSGRGLET